MSSLNVLVVDDDMVLRASLDEHLKNHKYVSSVTLAENGKRGLDRILKTDFEVVFLDIDLPLMSGMKVLEEAINKKPQTYFVLMTAYGKVGDAVKAIRLGAHTYLEKPLKPQSLEKILDDIANAHSLMESVSEASPLLFEEGREMVGSSKELKVINDLIRKVSKVDTPVLIQGPSGTGKELVARALHHNSTRNAMPFVAVNCSAVPENLFESEFFGHEKGAFTGADQRKIGKFQFAEGGTLFLDEIGDLSLANQVKLLRVLQEKKFTPVGLHQEIAFDVRVITATHKNLTEMVKKGDFRQDLYFRLNIMGLKLPSLKERKSDIPKLVKVFIEKFNEKHKKDVLGCRQDFLNLLDSYEWPGNIRELENSVERAFVLCESQWLEAKHLPQEVLGLKTGEVEGFNNSLVVTKEGEAKIDEESLVPEIRIAADELDFQKSKEEFEKKFIIEALKRNNGRLNQTALQANIPKKTLQRKIQKYSIQADDYKS